MRIWRLPCWEDQLYWPGQWRCSTVFGKIDIPGTCVFSHMGLYRMIREGCILFFLGSTHYHVFLAASRKKNCFILACSTQMYSSRILVSLYPWSSTFYLKVCEPRVWRKTTNCPVFSVPSRHGTRRVSTVKSARWCSLLITSWVTRKSRTVTRKCLIASPQGLASGFQKVANWGIGFSASGWTLSTLSRKVLTQI